VAKACQSHGERGAHLAHAGDSDSQLRLPVFF